MMSFVSWLPGDSGFGDSCGDMKSVSPSRVPGCHMLGATGGTQNAHKISVQVLLLYTLGTQLFLFFSVEAVVGIIFSVRFSSFPLSPLPSVSLFCKLQKPTSGRVRYTPIPALPDTQPGP